MYKNIVGTSGELDYLALTALVFFFSYFIYATWRAVRMKKAEVSHAEKLPFEEKINQRGG